MTADDVSHERLYERIRQDILAGELPPGTKLLETSTSARYGVSRTPMREALSLLAQDGVLEKLTRGYLVRRRSIAEITDIFEARIALESTAAGLAAQRRLDEDLAELRRFTRASRDEHSDRLAQELHNSGWHASLMSAAHNRTLADMDENARTLLDIYRPIVLEHQERTVGDDEPDDHQRITHAIEVRDPELATRLAKEHLIEARDRYIQALMESGFLED